MSVYIITGTSRGIGFEFVKQLSKHPNNLVVDLSNTSQVPLYDTLKQAATDTAKIVGERGVDYLVASGGIISLLDGFGPIGSLSDKVEELEAVFSELWQTNVVGNIHLFNIFIPLVQKGKVKKVISLSTGLADLDLTNEIEVDVAPLYGASKAAMNIIVAKYNAQYKKEGIRFMSISPDVVDLGHYDNITQEQMQGLTGFIGKLQTYAPHSKSPISTEESVRHVRSIWEKASIKNGYGGAFVSHYGNKQWL